MSDDIDPLLRAQAARAVRPSGAHPPARDFEVLFKRDDQQIAPAELAQDSPSWASPDGDSRVS